MTRPEALAKLLALPDEPCMPPRGRHYTHARDPKRDPWIIKRELGIAYVEHRRQDHSGGDSVVSVRRMRLVKRA
jgi:hypothetical protein